MPGQSSCNNNCRGAAHLSPCHHWHVVFCCGASAGGHVDEVAVAQAGNDCDGISQEVCHTAEVGGRPVFANGCADDDFTACPRHDVHAAAGDDGADGAGQQRAEAQAVFGDANTDDIAVDRPQVECTVVRQTRDIGDAHTGGHDRRVEAVKNAVGGFDGCTVQAGDALANKGVRPECFQHGVRETAWVDAQVTGDFSSG